jgi:hypothetical protein
MASEFRAKDFVGTAGCSSCGAEFHLLQLYRPNSKNDGFHTSCGNCGAKNQKKRTELVSVKIKAPKTDHFPRGQLPNQLQSRTDRENKKRQQKEQEEHDDLVDVAASIQRVEHARKALASHRQHFDASSFEATASEEPKKKKSKEARRLAALAGSLVPAPRISSALDPVDSEPVHKIGIGWAAGAREHRQPRRHRIASPDERSNSALDPRARRAVEPVGRIVENCLKPPAERDQWA